MHLLHAPAGFLPEVQRHQRRDIAPESIDDPGPHAQRLNLVLPEIPLRVIQVNDVTPVPDMVAKGAVRFVIEPFRVVLPQPGVRRGMVVDDINHALHAVRMNGIHQGPEVVHGAEFRIDSPVVPDRIGTAQGSLPVQLTERMNRHEPDDVRPKIPDAVQILLHLSKRAFLAVIADKNTVHHPVSEPRIRISRHRVSFPPAAQRSSLSGRPALPVCHLLFCL